MQMLFVGKHLKSVEEGPGWGYFCDVDEFKCAAFTLTLIVFEKFDVALDAIGSCASGQSGKEACFPQTVGKGRDACLVGGNPNPIIAFQAKGQGLGEGHGWLTV